MVYWTSVTLTYCTVLSSKLCILEVKGGIETNWCSSDLDDPKQQCIDDTTLWHMTGCPRSCEINDNKLKIYQEVQLMITKTRSTRLEVCEECAVLGMVSS